MSLYAWHLLVWMLPVALGQWVIGHHIFRRQWRAVVFVPLILGSYLIATDVVAIAQGVWLFNDDHLFGWRPLGVPIEEWAFFYLTSLLCVQSFLLFLPERLR